VSLRNYLSWVERARSFDALAALNPRDFIVTEHGDPERILGSAVTASPFLPAQTASIAPLPSVHTNRQSRRNPLPARIAAARFVQRKRMRLPIRVACVAYSDPLLRPIDRNETEVAVDKCAARCVVDFDVDRVRPVERVARECGHSRDRVRG
jgi:hypothetical protein